MRLIRNVIRFALLVLICFCATAGSSISKGDVSFRTSARKDDIQGQGVFFVAVDFSVQSGEHLYAPMGKGRQMSPSVSWGNAQVIDVHWPEHEQIREQDGSDSGYFGYRNDFTVLYKLRVIDKSKPITYELFYVSCGESCVPIRSSGVLELNGLLPNDEIKKCTGSAGTAAPSVHLLMILIGFIGGLILNFLPCVFPIVAMKAFAIVKSVKSGRRAIRSQGLAVSCGTITTFLALGIVLLTIRDCSPGVGWGFYMQNPISVLLLFFGFVASALHFFDMMRIGFRGIARSRLQSSSPLIGSLISGAFGAFSSAACAGPFAGLAVSSAVLADQSFLYSALIFMAIGAGVAAPFILISVYPGIVKMLPKPGRWLETFREFMGFAMLLSSVWPLWILISQVGSERAMLVVVCAIVLAMLSWMANKMVSKRGMTIAMTGAVVAISASVYVVRYKDNEVNKIAWVEYSEEVMAAARDSHRPVFLNFTASWCMNCHFNQRVFNNDDVVKAFKRSRIVAIRCDWTNRNKGVSDLLESYGSTSIPFYVFYPADGMDYVVLPGLLSKSSVLDVIGKSDGSHGSQQED
jgi:thiol:disulfide interchange protein DsbD